MNQNSKTIGLIKALSAKSAGVVMEEASYWNALLYQNVGNLEGQYEDLEQLTNTINKALVSADIRPLNRPNLLKGMSPINRWTDGENVLHTVVYGATNKHYATNEPYVKNVLNQAVETAGTDPDTITVTPLTLDAPITEPDDEVVSEGLTVTVSEAAESGYNNSELLIFNYGNHGEGELPVTNEYGELSLVVGQEYTLSCWARVTSGETMRIKFVYDAARMGEYNYDEIVDISNTDWRRFYWTFVFNPNGNQYLEYTGEKTVVDDATTDPPTTHTEKVQRRQAMWTRTVGIGVCRKYAGTVQLCGFRLTAGGLYMKTGVETLESQLAALEDRVAALEAMELENIGE